MRTCRTAQGTLLHALWWPKWEGNPRKEWYVYTYWLTSLYSRNQHNIVRQLYSSKINFKEKGSLLLMRCCKWTRWVWTRSIWERMCGCREKRLESMASVWTGCLLCWRWRQSFLGPQVWLLQSPALRWIFYWTPWMTCQVEVYSQANAQVFHLEK